ncbi:lysophospholipid acyltransferase family protein [Bacteroidota bacterium]
MRKLKNHFRQVYIEHIHQSYQSPVLLIGNHFSWWDGFIGYYLNFTIFKKRYHVMMLEEQLEKRMFLSKVGAFSVNKSSRSITESLSYSSEILSNRDNLLLLFPQGKIETIYTRSFVFERGIEKILTGLPETPIVYFMVNLVDYFSKEKPSLFIRTEKFDGDLTRENIQDSYNRFYDNCVSKQVEDMV